MPWYGGLFKGFSVNFFMPLAVNLVSGIVLLAVVQRWLRKERVGAGGQSMILVLVVVLTPLPILVIGGMEHTLQCLFSFLFVFYFSDWMRDSERNGGGAGLPWNISIWSFDMFYKI